MVHYLIMYTSTSYLEMKNIVTSVENNTNFSDHDAFKVQIRFRQNNQEDIDFDINK